MIACLLVRIGQNKVPVNALPDSVAKRSALDEAVSQKVGLESLQTAPFTVKVGGGKVNCYPSATRGRLPISTMDGIFIKEIMVRAYPEPVGDFPPFNWAAPKVLHSHLADLPIEPPIEGQPLSLLLPFQIQLHFRMDRTRSGAIGRMLKIWRLVEINATSSSRTTPSKAPLGYRFQVQ